MANSPQPNGCIASCYTFTRDGILIRTAPINSGLQTLFSSHLVPACYTFLTGLHHQDTQGKLNVRRDGTNDYWLHTAHGVCTLVQLMPMNSNWILRDAQMEASTFPTLSTPWVCGHWHFRTVLEDHDRKYACRQKWDIVLTLTYPIPNARSN